MQEYIFNKGELNSLNNLNQDIKTIFKTYAIIGNTISGAPILRKGTHHTLTQYVFPAVNTETHIVVIESGDLFQCIKTDKKNIKGYRIEDNGDLYLIGDSVSFPIGYVLNKDSIAAKPFIESVKSLFQEQTVSTVKLTEDDVEDLVKNAMKPIQSNQYRTRITREVIPGLKKTHDVFISFSDIDDKTFGLHIVANRATCVSYHSYKCLYV